MKRYGKDFDEKESLEYMATGTQGKLKKVGFESTTPIIRKSEAVSIFTSNLYIQMLKTHAFIYSRWYNFNFRILTKQLIMR